MLNGKQGLTLMLVTIFRVKYNTGSIKLSEIKLHSKQIALWLRRS
jgi:hypothetical protein